MKKDLIIFISLFIIVVILTSFITYTIIKLESDMCISQPLNYTKDFYAELYPDETIDVRVYVITKDGLVGTIPPNR